MQQLFGWLLVTGIVVTAAGCTTVALAPGADQVKLTHNAADVSACKPVGNVSASGPTTQVWDIEPLLRNRAVGLGGNTVFLATNTDGVAYRCP